MMQQDRDANARRVKGKEQYIVAGGSKETVTVWDVDGRVTPAALLGQFAPGFRIFLRCRNLHRVPDALKGCVLYLPKERKIVKVLAASFGRAHVLQLFPPTVGPNPFFTTILQEGHLLQQQVGEPLGQFNHTAMGVPHRQLIAQTGHIVAVVDSCGYSKHRIQGPDVYLIDQQLSYEHHKRSDAKNLAKDPWVVWHPDAIIKKPKELALAQVAVVYVHAQDPSLYTTKLTVLEDGEAKGIVTIPTTSSTSSSSDR